MNLFGGFANPALLFGLLAAAVPIAIHLLNRRNHRPLPWAAMRFVEAAWRKTRRRVQFEEWLLLLLRALAVGFLAFALARPFTGEASPLAGLTEARRELVIVVDSSASMGQAAGTRTAWEAALERARALTREADPARGDRVRLIAAAATPRLLSTTTPEQARSLLDSLAEPTDEVIDLAAALYDVLEHARNDASNAGAQLDVHVLTDLQESVYLRGAEADERTAANAQAAPGERSLYEVLDGLKELKVKVIVEDMAGVEPVPPNVSLAALEPLERPSAPDAPVELRATVRNDGDRDARGVRVALSVDGQRRPLQTIDVPARSSAEAVFVLSFGSGGLHVVEAKLEAGDRLPRDDERAIVVDVPAAVRVLLVNGNQATRIEEDELGYLRTVLVPAVEDGALALQAPFEVVEITPADLGSSEVDLTKHDVIWLADCEAPPPSVAEKLDKAVTNGVSLIVSAGDRVDPRAWNQRMGEAGRKLMPVELLEFDGQRTREGRWSRPRSFDARHPALAFFADERFAPLFAEIPVYGWIASKPLDGARVLASLDDDRAAPLFVEREHGRGRVWWWATTIGPAWTRLPESPATLVPLAWEWLRDAGSPAPAPLSLPPNSVWRGTTAQYPRQALVITPAGARKPLDGEAIQQGGRWSLPPIPTTLTDRAGAYRIEIEGQAPLAFAIGLDPRESDLRRIDSTALTALHPVLQSAQAPRADDTNDNDTTRQGELWRAFALAVLAALVIESLWAAWIGHRRSA